MKPIRGVGRIEPLELDWTDLYTSLYPPMVRLAGLLVGDYQIGEEIAQDAFARLVEARASVSGSRAYLRATIVNLCRSRIRRSVVARRRRTVLVDRSPDDDRLARQVADRLAVRDALRRLPRRQREAVVLRFYADLSEAETAMAMGVSVGSVKTHLHRAMHAMTSTLDGLP